MSAFPERFGLFARSPDARPLAEIAADIDAELAFHVEESTRALAAEGLDAGSAHTEALRRFGDYGRIRRECTRTQMGERIMLQRIQIVLTAVLIAAVALLVVSNRESKAAMAVERQAQAALLARLEAQFALRAAIPPGERGEQLVIDRRPVQVGDAVGETAGNYLGADGSRLNLEGAVRSWETAFDEEPHAWRHGLRIAERLAALSDAQGVEILTALWGRTTVEHREQVMKPFVFDGGSPHALEVLQLGFDDDQTSVKARAVLYLHTYAWKDLWRGETTGRTWFAEFRDRPVAEVLAANATRWARDFGLVLQTYDYIKNAEAGDLLDAAAKVDPTVYAKAGVDLGAILKAHGVCGLDPKRLELDANRRAAAERVLSWCR